MLVQPTDDEGANSERPSDTLPTPSPPHFSEVPVEPQSDPSPRPLPSTIIHDSIPESSGGNLGGLSSSDKSLSGNEGEMTLQSVYDLCISLCTQVSDQAKEIQHLKAHIKKLKKQAKPVVKHHKAWMKSVSLKQRLARKRSSKKQWVHRESVSKQGRKFAKGEPTVHKDPLFDEILEDSLDYIETENAQDEGRTRDEVDEEKENAEMYLVRLNKKLAQTRESTDEQAKGTDDHTEGGRATQTTQPPTSTIFGDDETIAQVLLNMSQAKAVSREKEKGVEFKDIEETDRPRPTSTRSLLTLKPLPKIDPKDKGKKKIEVEDESDGIPEAEKKFKQLASDEEMARKVQEECFKKKKKSIFNRRKEQNSFMPRIAALKENSLLNKDQKLSGTDHLQRIELRNSNDDYLKNVGNFKHSDLKTRNWKIVTWRLYESCGVCILEFEDGIVIHMLVERRYPLSKDLLQRMLDLGLEVERESSVALDLIRFIKQQIDERHSTQGELNARYIYSARRNQSRFHCDAKLREDRSDIVYQEAKRNILLVHVYVDDIIFGSTNKELCTGFEKLMKDKFQMSSMENLLSSRITSTTEEMELFISHDKICREIFEEIQLQLNEVCFYSSCFGKAFSSKMEMLKMLISSYKGFDAGRIRTSLFEGRLLMSIYSQARMDGHVISKVCQKESKTSRHVKRGRDTKIPQSSGPPIKVGDEAVHKELGDRMERPATTASSLEAEQDSDAQNRFENTFEKSNDPPLSRGYTLRSGEDSMKLLELMELCTKLSDFVSKKKREIW
ncbi:hypothetical protein Tco_0913434 [Tanacetum coccineum]